MSLDLAKKLIFDKKYIEALDLLELTLKSESKNRYIHYEIAKTCLFLNNFKRAKEALSEVLNIKPDWAGAHALMGSAELSLGLYKDAAQSYINSLKYNNSEMGEYVKFFCSNCDNILNRDKTPQKSKHLLDLVEKLCDFDEEIHSSNSWNNLYRGCVEFIRGDMNKASVFFGRVSEKCEYSLGRHASGALSMRSTSFITQIKTLAPSSLSHFEWLLKANATNNEYVVLISCDGKYFRSYAIIAIESVLNMTQSVVHVNLINPEKDDLHLLNAIAEKYKGRVSITKQTFINSNARCFYACSRFFIVPTLIQEYNCPIMTLDADSSFIADIPKDLLKKMLKADFSYKSVMEAPLTHFPWRHLAVGITLFNNTKGGRNFAAILRSYLTSIFILDADSNSYWYIDQSAVVCLLKALKSELKTYNLQNFTSKFCVFPNAQIETKEEFVEKYRANNPQ